MDKRPIGVFDSGIGGLTVLKKIAKALPNEDLIYFGDTARVPYGTRSKETIRKFAQEDVNFLLTKNVKCIVIACHTVSSVAAIQNGSTASVPIINATTPTLNFLKDAKRKRIAVIGTRGTISSGVYKKSLRKTKVTEQECPLLVPIIEEGEKGEVLESAMRLYLSNIKKVKPDLVVLACTHYPIIKKEIKDFLGDVEILDPADLISQELKRFLVSNHLQSKSSKKGGVKFFVTDTVEHFAKNAKELLREEVSGKIERIKLTQ